jgi:hypothetical protein
MQHLSKESRSWVVNTSSRRDSVKKMAEHGELHLSKSLPQAAYKFSLVKNEAKYYWEYSGA